MTELLSGVTLSNFCQNFPTVANFYNFSETFKLQKKISDFAQSFLRAKKNFRQKKIPGKKNFSASEKWVIQFTFRLPVYSLKLKLELIRWDKKFQKCSQTFYLNPFLGWSWSKTKVDGLHFYKHLSHHLCWWLRSFSTSISVKNRHFSCIDITRFSVFYVHKNFIGQTWFEIMKV